MRAEIIMTMGGGCFLLEYDIGICGHVESMRGGKAWKISCLWALLLQTMRMYMRTEAIASNSDET